MYYSSTLAKLNLYLLEFAFCRILFEMNFLHDTNDCEVCLYFSFVLPEKTIS